MKCVALRPLHIGGVTIPSGEVIHLTEARAAELGNAVAILAGKAGPVEMGRDPIIPPANPGDGPESVAEQSSTTGEAPKDAAATEVAAEESAGEEAPIQEVDPAERSSAADETPKNGRRGKGK